MHTPIDDFQQASQQVTEHLKVELGKLRTGRAAVSLVDAILVEAYGTRMPLIELASITTPDPTLIVVSPWDKSIIGAIEKAIMQAEIGLSPAVDGTLIRLPIPALTQDKREEMVKVAHKKTEEARVMLRTARGEAKQGIEAAQAAGGVSEDETKRLLTQLEHDQHEAAQKLDEILAQKEKSIMTI